MVKQRRALVWSLSGLRLQQSGGQVKSGSFYLHFSHPWRLSCVQLAEDSMCNLEGFYSQIDPHKHLI